MNRRTTPHPLTGTAIEAVRAAGAAGIPVDLLAKHATVYLSETQRLILAWPTIGDRDHLPLGVLGDGNASGRVLTLGEAVDVIAKAVESTLEATPASATVTDIADRIN